MRLVHSNVALLLVSWFFVNCGGNDDCYEEDGNFVCVEETSVPEVTREAVYSMRCMQDQYGNYVGDDIVCPTRPGPGGGDDIWDSDNEFIWDVTVISREDELGWFSTCVDGCCTSRLGSGCCDRGTCWSWCYTTGRCSMAESRNPGSGAR